MMTGRSKICCINIYQITSTFYGPFVSMYIYIHSYIHTCIHTYIHMCVFVRGRRYM